MIRTIEERALNAWPALQVLLLDGWVLRFAEGYTRRANSVNPLYPPHNSLVDQIAACEQCYSLRGLPVVFKLTPASQPQGLDEVLARRGYTAEAPTAVQTLDLRRPLQAPTHSATLEEALSTTWLESFAALGGLRDRQRDILSRMLGHLVPRACYATLYEGSESVACGLAVLEGEYLGLFDIVTAATRRRHGYATQLLSNLLAWGQRGGARTAYLQVMCDNVPALRLYDRLGFHECYQYAYRCKR